jgi:hypothetical protein
MPVYSKHDFIYAFRLTLVILLGGSVLITGCTRSVRVSEADFQPDSSSVAEEQREVGFQGDYIFHMADGRDVSPTRFTVRDSSFVISEMYDGQKSVPVDTLVLLMSEVESIERISLWRPSVFIVAIPIAALFALTVYLGMGMSGMD